MRQRRFEPPRPIKVTRLQPSRDVILELDYFMGSLGRDRTAALYAHGVELPSDIHGMLSRLGSAFEALLEGNGSGG
jgi:hypothetical protein